MFLSIQCYMKANDTTRVTCWSSDLFFSKRKMSQTMLHNLKHGSRKHYMPRIQLNHQSKFLHLMVILYQANKSICIKDKVMLCCFNITYKGVHSTNLNQKRITKTLYFFLFLPFSFCLLQKSRNGNHEQKIIELQKALPEMSDV